MQVAVALELARSGQALHGRLARPGPQEGGGVAAGEEPGDGLDLAAGAGQPGMRPAAHRQQDPPGLAAGPDERRRGQRVDLHAQRPGGDLDLAGDPLARVAHRDLLRPAVGGDRLEVAGLLQLRPAVTQQDVPPRRPLRSALPLGTTPATASPAAGGSGAGASSLGWG